MRIVHIITRFLNAGAEENTLYSCNGQVENGHEVHLIYGREVAQEKLAALHPAVRRYQVRSLVREIHPLLDKWAAFRIYRMLKYIQPDIVHTHTSKAGIVGRIAARRARVPHIIHGVHMLAFEQVSSFKRMVYLHAERIVARYTDLFINVSEGTREVCLKYGIGAPEQHVFIPSGMDIKKFQKAKKKDWKKLIDPQTIATANPKFILYVGSFESRKRHEAFLPVFRNIVNRHPDAVLLLLGEGECKIGIEDAIHRLDLDKHVCMLGFRQNVEDFIALSHMGILTSTREGLPRVVIQYLLGGLPVVCTRTPGIEQIVHDGVNGFLTGIHPLEHIETHIHRLLAEEKLHQAMVKAARKTDLSAWSVEHMVAELEKAYKRVVTLSTAGDFNSRK